MPTTATPITTPPTAPTTTPVTGPLAAPVSTDDLEALQVHMAYLTDDGRNVIVVFNGNEDDFDDEMRPFRNEQGAVRIIRRGEGPVADRVDWYTGTLTPVEWEHAPIAVQFKDEGDLDGDTVGPMRLLFAGEDAHRLRPYNPDRKRAPWVTRDHAILVAANLGLILRES